MQYPKKLHDKHNHYPIAAVKVRLGDVDKLVPNLNTKENDVIHYRALKQCLQLGLTVTKVHRILEFEQTSWMKPYMDLNTKNARRLKMSLRRIFSNT